MRRIVFDNGESIHASGAVAALPIWAELVNQIPQHISGSEFKIPPGIVEEEVCILSGLLPSQFGCTEVRKEVFLQENTPQETCPLHGIQVFDTIIKGIKKLAP